MLIIIFIFWQALTDFKSNIRPFRYPNIIIGGALETGTDILKEYFM